MRSIPSSNVERTSSPAATLRQRASCCNVAAEGKDAEAALTLAGTYDSAVLEKLGVKGLSADVAKARAWYERAKEFGSAEARRRLELLASRDR
jgi:TPR repeat protein